MRNCVVVHWVSSLSTVCCRHDWLNIQTNKCHQCDHYLKTLTGEKSNKCSSVQLGLLCFFDQRLLPTRLDQYAQYSNTCFDLSNYWCDDGHGDNRVRDDDNDDLVNCEDDAANGPSSLLP